MIVCGTLWHMSLDRTVRVRVSGAGYAQLLAMAAERDWSVSQLVRSILAGALQARAANVTIPGAGEYEQATAEQQVPVGRMFKPYPKQSQTGRHKA